MSERILALDCATKTGWAALLAGGSVESGVQSFAPRRGESTGMRFLRFRRWLLEVLAMTRADVIAYEDAIRHHKGQAAAAVAHGMAAIVQEVACDLGIEHTPVKPNEVKRHATGKGNAGKAAMIAAATSRWPGQEIEDDNQADALLLLAYAIDQTGPIQSEAREVVASERGHGAAGLGRSGGRSSSTGQPRDDSGHGEGR